MIRCGEIVNLFLEKNLISEFFLTEIHKNYKRDIYLDLNHFKKWTKKEIKKTEHSKINFLISLNYES